MSNKYAALETLGLGLMQWGAGQKDRELKREAMQYEQQRNAQLDRLAVRAQEFAEQKHAEDVKLKGREFDQKDTELQQMGPVREGQAADYRAKAEGTGSYAPTPVKPDKPPTTVQTADEMLPGMLTEALERTKGQMSEDERKQFKDQVKMVKDMLKEEGGEVPDNRTVELYVARQLGLMPAEEITRTRAIERVGSFGVPGAMDTDLQKAVQDEIKLIQANPRMYSMTLDEIERLAYERVMNRQGGGAASPESGPPPAAGGSGSTGSAAGRKWQNRNQSQ